MRVLLEIFNILDHHFEHLSQSGFRTICTFAQHCRFYQSGTVFNQLSVIIMCNGWLRQYTNIISKMNVKILTYDNVHE